MGIGLIPFSQTMRILHNGSVSVFQTDGGGSIPPIRSLNSSGQGMVNSWMETWASFRQHIKDWSKLVISDQDFYCYLINAQFEPPDQRVADIFIRQHDNGEWSHVIYHRMCWMRKTDRRIPCCLCYLLWRRLQDSYWRIENLYPML